MEYLEYLAQLEYLDFLRYTKNALTFMNDRMTTFSYYNESDYKKE